MPSDSSPSALRACFPSSLFENTKQADDQPRTATLRDLNPTDKAKVSRLLRRVLSLSSDNERLSSSSAATAAARDEEASELRKRLDVALDSLAEARRRAESAETKLRAAVGSCVCGAASGAGGGVGREVEEEEEEERENFCRSNSNNATTTTTANCSRNLIFNESKGAFEFESRDAEEQQQPRRRKAAASRGSNAACVSPPAAALSPSRQQEQRRRETTKSLQALVADVEASLAAAALRR